MVVSVVYLARKANHPRYTRAFLHSLIKHDARHDFRLVYVLKGYEGSEDDPAFIELQSRLPCPISRVRVPDSVSATQLFFDVGRQCDLVLALNSWSRILADGWLKAYVAAFENPACGIVAATGSFEGIPGAPFPNPALRTNAFMLRGTTIADLDLTGIDSRAGNLQFEAGPRSLTQQILNKGLTAWVVDRNTRLYPPADWPLSRTFRSGAQENLLIGDNRTAHYQIASTAKRRKLAELAFGPDAVVERSNSAQRCAFWAKWRYPNGLADILRGPGESGVVPS